MAKTFEKWILASFAASTLLACGGPPPDDKKVTGSAPPALVVGVASGLAPMAAGDHRLEATVGNPLGKKFSSPGGDQIEPGLLTQPFAR